MSETTTVGNYLDRAGAVKLGKGVKAKAVAAANEYTDQQIEAKKYVLPAAGATLGGVKAGGTGIAIAADGTISATGTAAVDPSALPLASKTQKGAVVLGDGVELVEGKLTVTHPDVYTKTEADGKFQTAEQVNAIAAGKIASLVDGAPESLDTLKEIADTLNKDTEGGIVNGIMTAIGKKADADNVYTKTAADGLVNTAKSELTTLINGKATPSDVATAKQEAISAAATSAASLYQPKMTPFTDAEIDAILAEIV